MPPMSDDEEDQYLVKVPDWELNRSGVHTLRQEFKFKNFMAALDFVNKVGVIADDEGHHPDIHIYYSKVVLELYTHAIGGLSENDFIMAAKINSLK
jgi:4a-hydroxytetrahydrobiopterin dehydratase